MLADIWSQQLTVVELIEVTAIMMAIFACGMVYGVLIYKRSRENR